MPPIPRGPQAPYTLMGKTRHPFRTLIQPWSILRKTKRSQKGKKKLQSAVFYTIREMAALVAQVRHESPQDVMAFTKANALHLSGERMYRGEKLRRG